MKYAVSELVAEHFPQVRAVYPPRGQGHEGREGAADGRNSVLGLSRGRAEAERGRWHVERQAEFADGGSVQKHLQKGLEQLEQEKHVSVLPPVVIGSALIIPRGLLAGCRGSWQAHPSLAPRIHGAVMEIERYFGFDPKDVSSVKCCYDIESYVSEELRVEASASLSFIEVKGRANGRWERHRYQERVLTALNKPDQFIFAIVDVMATVLARPIFKNLSKQCQILHHEQSFLILPNCLRRGHIRSEVRGCHETSQHEIRRLSLFLKNGCRL